MKNRCPKCGFGRTDRLGDGRLQCRKCRKTFSKKKAVGDHYRIPEQEKTHLLECVGLGVPVSRSRFKLGRSRPTAERFFSDIRRTSTRHEQRPAPLTGEVEMDESAFGRWRKGKRGWGAAGKIRGFGIYKRNGAVRLSLIPDRTWETLYKAVANHTTPGSLYSTDDYQADASLNLSGTHVVVPKEKGRPRGRHTINGIEGFWSYAKNWLYQDRGVAQKFFPFFLSELAFRVNHRDEDITPYVYQLLCETPYADLPKIGPN